jgi:hypothetical protein
LRHAFSASDDFELLLIALVDALTRHRNARSISAMSAIDTVLEMPRQNGYRLARDADRHAGRPRRASRRRLSRESQAL